MSMNKFLVNSFESIPMDIALLEFTVKNWKWLSYVSEYLDHHLKTKIFYWSFNKNIRSFDLTIANESLENVMGTFDPERLRKNPTCFQSSNPSYIDLLLENKKELFKNTDIIEVEISDHSLIVRETQNHSLIGF